MTHSSNINFHDRISLLTHTENKILKPIVRAVHKLYMWVHIWWTGRHTQPAKTSLRGRATPLSQEASGIPVNLSPHIGDESYLQCAYDKSTQRVIDWYNERAYKDEAAYTSGATETAIRALIKADKSAVEPGIAELLTQLHGKECSICGEALTPLVTEARQKKTHLEGFKAAVAAQRANIEKIRRGLSLILDIYVSDSALKDINEEAKAISQALRERVAHLHDGWIQAHIEQIGTLSSEACDPFMQAIRLEQNRWEADPSIAMTIEDRMLQVSCYRYLYRLTQLQKLIYCVEAQARINERQRQLHVYLHNIEQYIQARQALLPEANRNGLPAPHYDPQSTDLSRFIPDILTYIEELHACERTAWRKDSTGLITEPHANLSDPANLSHRENIPTTGGPLPRRRIQANSDEKFLKTHDFIAKGPSTRRAEDQAYLAKQLLRCVLSQNSQGSYLTSIVNRLTLLQPPYSMEDAALMKVCLSFLEASYRANRECLTRHITQPTALDAHTLTLDFQPWYVQLQRVWSDHLSLPTRIELCQHAPKERQKESQRLFAQWMYEKTGLKWNRKLSFNEALFTDQPERKAQAVLDKLHEKKQWKKVAKTNHPMLPIEEPFFGVDKRHITSDRAPTPTAIEEPSTSLTHEPLLPSHKTAQKAENFVASIGSLGAIPETLEGQITWLNQLDLSQGIFRPEGPSTAAFLVYSVFVYVINNPDSKDQITSLVGKFVEFVTQCQLLQRDNSWRKEVLSLYLKLAPSELTVSATQEKYLNQVATLANALLPHYATTLHPSETEWHQGLAQLAQVLQTKSFIQLEGLPGSLVSCSYQEASDSGCISADDTSKRVEINGLLASGAAYLIPQLFTDIEQAHPFDHPEGQQARERAISLALTHDPESMKPCIMTAMMNSPKTEADNPLQLPKSIFYHDLMIDHAFSLSINPTSTATIHDINTALDVYLNITLPGDISVDRLRAATVYEFNNQLMQAKSDAQLLMGYARQIVLLSYLYQRTPDEGFFLRLLKYKIAYHYLKHTYFGKKEMGGFLRNATHKAEHLMAQMALSCSKSSHSMGVESIIQGMKQVDPCDANSLHERKTLELFKGVDPSKATLTGTLLSIGNNKVVDVTSGALYQDGQLCVDLPPEVGNFPDVRLLDLHELPYREEGNGTFVHYSESEDGTEVAQVTLMRTETSVSIYKRMKLLDRYVTLRYLPLDQVAFLPRVLSDMGIREFWRDDTGQVTYGYTKKGELVASVDDSNIITRQGRYRIPSESDITTLPGLQHITQAVTREALLLSEDQLHIEIPAFGLTVSQTPGGSWCCQGGGVSGLFLDQTALGEGCLVLYSQETQPLSTSDQNKITSYQEQIMQLQKEVDRLKRDHFALRDKHRRYELTQKLKEVQANYALLTQKRVYLSLDSKSENYTAHRVEVVNRLRALRHLSTQLDRTTYLEQEAEYARVEADFLATPLFGTTYTTSADGFVKGRDLASCALLLAKQLEKGAQITQKEEVQWIHELAHYAESVHILDPRTRFFIEKAEALLANKTTLFLLFYVRLLLLQHHFSRLHEAIKNVASSEEISRLQKTYDKIETICTPLLKLTPPEAPSEVTGLMHKYFPEHFLNTAVIDAIPLTFDPLTPHVVTHMSALRSSWIERLGLSKQIQYQQKTIETLDPEQRRCTERAKTFCPDQVAGFYYETLGYFSPSMFAQLFRRANHTYMEGMDVARAEAVFNCLVQRGVFVQTTRGSATYCLNKNAQTLSKAEVLALLSKLYPSLSHRVKERIADQIERFFLQTVSLGFSFIWTPPAIADEVTLALNKAKARYEQEMWQAEHFLSAWLPQHGLSLTELKCLALTGHSMRAIDGISHARNALLRYLFYKTEIQHIDNILNASDKGERNKMELLMTPRAYGIDLAALATCQDQDPFQPKREEQLLQWAFLLYEEDYGYRCNAEQFRLFRALMLDLNNPEYIDAMQARMGFGKTALLALLALVQVAKEIPRPSDQRCLVRYVVPPPVLQDNATLFNERISHLLGSNVIQDQPFARYQIDDKNQKGSLEFAKIDLQRRLNFYNHARRSGLVLIQPPDIQKSLQAQSIAFNELRVKEENQQLWLECKQLLGRILSTPTYTIFDELDKTQESTSGDVNFTEGTKKYIKPSTINTIRILIESIASYLSLNPIRKDGAVDKQALAKALLESLLGSSDPAVFARRSQFLTDSTTGIKLIGMEGEKTKDDLLLARALCLDPNLLAFAYEQQPGTHFGIRFTKSMGQRKYSYDPASEAPLVLAVPYESTATPHGLSLFENTEVAAIATLRYYASDETPLEEAHLDFLLAQMRRNAISKELLEIFQDSQTFPNVLAIQQRLQRIVKLRDQTQIQQEKAAFLKDFFENPQYDVRNYLGMCIVATQVGVDAEKANSSRYVMGSLEDITKGCSGTLSNGLSSYFIRPELVPAADGKISFGIMCRSDNQKVFTLKEPIPNLGVDAEEARTSPLSVTEPHLDRTLDALIACMQPNTCALIDAAGLCKSQDGNPETIVRLLWEKLQQAGAKEKASLKKLDKLSRLARIQGIIYYNENHAKMLYRGVDQPPIPCTTEMEEKALDEDLVYFSFFADRNARGSNIKQANGVNALVTVDANTSNSDAKQAVLRVRNLVDPTSGQSFNFVIPERFEQLLKTECGKGVHEELASGDIVFHLLHKEVAECEQEALMLFKKELKEHVKQMALFIEFQLFNHINLSQPDNRTHYQVFLAQRKAIIDLMEKPDTELRTKYGCPLKQIKKDDFIRAQTDRALTSIYKLRNLYCDTKNVLGITPMAPTTIITFFESRVGQSAALFRCRFSANTLEDRETNSGTTATAVALAEAQAQAVAAALATAIDKEVVIAHAPLTRSNVPMSTSGPLFSIATNWCQDPAQGNLPIKDQVCLEMAANPRELSLKDLIHPDLQDKIGISPHLQQARGLAPRFALVPRDPQSGRPYLFISQEEANAWEASSPRSCDYKLLLLERELDTTDRYVANMRCALLLYDPLPGLDRIGDTAALRAMHPVNMNADQLLPHLEVTVAPVDPSVTPTNYFNAAPLHRFGVHAPTELSFTITNEASGLVVSDLPGPPITIPYQHETFNRMLTEAYTQGENFSGVVKKQQVIEEELETHRVTLEEKQRNLQKAKEALTSVMVDPSGFQLTYRDTDEVLKAVDPLARDRELEQLKKEGRFMDSSLVYPSRLPQPMLDAGQHFRAGILTIQQAQQKYQDGGYSSDDLTELKKAINAFISPIMQKAIEELDTIEQQKQLLLESDSHPSSNSNAPNLHTLVYTQYQLETPLEEDSQKKPREIRIVGGRHGGRGGGRFPSAQVQTTPKPSTVTSLDKLQPLEIQNSLCWKPTVVTYPFDTMYARILYAIHKGNIDNATCCVRLDCKAMFTQVLPSLTKTIKSIKENITKAESIDAIIIQTNTEIEDLKKEKIELEKISETIRTMQEVGKQLYDRNALPYLDNSIWDCIPFHLSSEWQEGACINVGLKATLPTYTTTINPTAQAYPKKVVIPNESEKTILRNYDVLSHIARNAATEVVDRQQEVLVQ